MGCFFALNKGLAEWMVLAIPSAAGTGPLNTTGMITTQDAAVKPEAWIRFETRERGYETGERKYGEYESGIDVESMGSREARLATLGLSPKSPVVIHPMPPHHPPTRTARPGEDSANPGRYRLKFLGGPGRTRHFGFVFARVVDSCNPSALVAPSALPSSE
jgi:hypothetical protein